jgi:hypothetical protein
MPLCPLGRESICLVGDQLVNRPLIPPLPAESPDGTRGRRLAQRLDCRRGDPAHVPITEHTQARPKPSNVGIDRTRATVELS